MAPFQHQKLQSKDHIRLLRFLSSGHGSQSKLSGRLHQSPTFELIQEPRHSAPPYCAISYTWGAPNQTSHINLPQGEMPITETLERALPYLIRASSGTNYLWIDQICIDQGSNREKSEQILFMKDIYAKAERTLIWLGEDHEGIGMRVQELTQYIVGREAFRPRGAGIEGLDEAGMERDRELTVKKLSEVLDFEPGSHSNGASLLSGVKKLLTRPWFTRAWVFQEFVLSPRSLFLLGSLRFSVADLVGVVYGTAMAEVRACRDTDDYGLGVVYELPAFNSFTRMIAKMDEVSGTEVRESPIFFLDAIGNSTQTTNPRDAVYAFLGLLDDPKYVFSPDYELSVVDVFTETARVFINGCGSLDILAVNSGPCPTRDGLPSWVPDWGGEGGKERPGPASLILSGKNASIPFRAARDFQYVPQANKDPQQLVTRGRYLDSVRGVLHRFPGELSLTGPHKWRQVLELDELLAKCKSQVEQPVDTAIGKEHPKISFPTVTRERLLNVVVAGGAGQQGGALASPTSMPLTAERVQEFLNVYDGNVCRPGSFHNLSREDFGRALADLEALRELCRNAAGNLLLRGVKGKLGLGPSMARLGDMICILHGSKVPVILRWSSNGVGDGFRVVGQCFWEDAMYGEAVDWPEDEADRFVII